MIIYNVTVKVENDIHEDWINWMRETHIPDVMATGKFIEHQFAKVLVDDEDGITYAVQYKCQDMETLTAYYEEYAPELQKEHTERFKDKFVAFRTLLEVV
ncbi:MAG: DUF4286 family protein [Salibacteraceae bacterium]